MRRIESLSRAMIFDPVFPFADGLRQLTLIAEDASAVYAQIAATLSDPSLIECVEPDIVNATLGKHAMESIVLQRAVEEGRQKLQRGLERVLALLESNAGPGDGAGAAARADDVLGDGLEVEGAEVAEDLTALLPLRVVGDLRRTLLTSVRQWWAMLRHYLPPLDGRAPPRPDKTKRKSRANSAEGVESEEVAYRASARDGLGAAMYRDPSYTDGWTLAHRLAAANRGCFRGAVDRTSGQNLFSYLPLHPYANLFLAEEDGGVATVRSNEPTSVVAHALSSPTYRERLTAFGVPAKPPNTSVGHLESYR